LSNGERDVISFFAMLARARTKLKKARCILIIDEIFDYLDDANLVAAQYYLTQLIEEFKTAGRKLYPLIFTHLEPGYFRNYYFKDQKVYYLKETQPHFDRRVENIIIAREDTTIKDSISKHFLHYHPTSVDLSGDFSRLNLDARLADSSEFKQHVTDEMAKYLGERAYDPISVCCAVRSKIEEHAHNQLDPTAQTQYLAKKTTLAKLQFVQEHGVDVPEIHFLLGIIYNVCLHLRESTDNFTPVRSKLENKTIRNMITEI